MFSYIYISYIESFYQDMALHFSADDFYSEGGRVNC